MCALPYLEPMYVCSQTANANPTWEMLWGASGQNESMGDSWTSLNAVDARPPCGGYTPYSCPPSPKKQDTPLLATSPPHDMYTLKL